MAATFSPDWDSWPTALLDFWTERHLCLLTTLRADGRPHVVPVGVAVDHEQRCAWVITDGASVKVRHVARPVGMPAPVAAGQVDGARWATIEGTAVVRSDPASVGRAVSAYAGRYRQPRPNPTRVALRIEIDRILCSNSLIDRPR